MPIIYGLLAIYGVLVFAIILLLAAPTYFFVFAVYPSERAPYVAHRISRFWAHVILFVLLVRVKVKNMNLPVTGKTCVMVSNHLSQLDVPVYAIACRSTVRFLAKAELGKIPLLGYIIRKSYFMVNRGDRSDRAKIMISMQKNLEEGVGLFICPEGTRNRTPEPLLPFKDGAFRLAILSQVPLGVLVIYDSHLRNRPASPLSLIPGVIHAEWLEVIETKGMTEKDVDFLKNYVWKKMHDSIIAWRKEHGT